MFKITLIPGGTVQVNGQPVGYIEDYKLYMHGRLIGEYSTHSELIRMIQEELNK